MSAPDALLVTLLAGGASFVGEISGFGFALLIVPPLALVVGAKEAVVLANLLGLAHTVAMFVRLRRSVAWRFALPLTVAAWVGMPFGLLVLVLAPARALELVLGATVLAATVLIWRGGRLPGRGMAAHAVTGFVSGVLNTSTGMNGPPVVLHLQGHGLAPIAFRATLAAFFLTSSLLAIALYAGSGRIDPEIVLGMVAGAPGLAVGWLAGNAVFPRVSPARFHRLVLGILCASATVLVVGAVV